MNWRRLVWDLVSWPAFGAALGVGFIALARLIGIDAFDFVLLVGLAWIFADVGATYCGWR